MSSHRSRRRRPQIIRRTEPGASPGTIAPHPTAKSSVMTLIAYGHDQFVEKPLSSLDQLPDDWRDTYSVAWINVDGLGNTQLIERLGERFQLHRLALEDAVNTHQRAKVEVYGDVVFIVARMTEPSGLPHTEQLSMFVGPQFVITLQEEAGDCWAPVRDRLRSKAGRLPHSGPDYLAYALLDSVIDAYFPILERLGEELDALDELAATGRGAAMPRIHRVHSELLLLRRAIRPHREAVAELARDSTPAFTDQTKVYLRDCYDHVIQLIDLAETYREMTTDVRELYLSAVGLRTNEIMRVLTVIATIFIPLTFIVGIYGMNFENMPELRWKWGYAWSWGLMLATTAALLAYFQWRGWLVGHNEVTPEEIRHRK